MPSSSVCRLLRMSVVVAAAWWCFAAAVAAVAAEPAYKSWFRYGSGVEVAWEFLEVPNNSMQVVIQPHKQVRPADQPLRRVMVLYPRQSSAYDIAITSMLRVFEDKNIRAEFLVVNFDNSDQKGKLALELAHREKYELILSMGSESTAWLWDNYRDGQLPVISVCSKDPVILGQIASYNVGTGTNFAFTSLNMPNEVQMAYVLEFKPDLKNLGILVDSKNISAVQTQAIPMGDSARKLGIQVIDIAVSDPEQAKQELTRKVRDAVATMRKNDPTLGYSLFWITGSTSVFREIQAINASSDRVPVLSVVPDVVKAGSDSAVLSIGIGFESNAYLAAIYAADVLSGRAKVGDLHVGIVSPPDIAINFRKAREIGLDIPFSFFESASVVYDYEGKLVRENGKAVVAEQRPAQEAGQ